MNKLLILSCSKGGYEASLNLQDKILKISCFDEIYLETKTEALPLISYKNSIKDCVREYIEKVNVIIFVCACGIAVRTMADFIKHKSIDPAVLVMDENMKFIIPVLSGHIGGANEYALKISEVTNAIPVITTASDIREVFSIDIFAKKNNLYISDYKKAKDVAAKIINDEKINIKFDEKFTYKILGKDDLIVFCDKKEDVLISPLVYENNALKLIPKNLVIGVGCRKNTHKEDIEFAIKKVLADNKFSLNAVDCLVSIDIKKNENGIIEFCKDNNIEFKTYTASELMSVKGDFEKSEFVQSVTGVDNVCERAATLEADNLPLIKKTVVNSVTVSIAIKEVYINFEYK